jgi:MFS family permease
MTHELERPPPSATAIRRRPELDALTLLCYGAVGTFGFLSNGLGPVLPFLQIELAVGREQVGTFPILLALGLITVGILGNRFVGLVGRRVAFWAGFIGVSSGALILTATSNLLVVGVGVALLGVGGATLIFLVPAILADRHGHLATRAIVESTGIVSASAILAPMLISLSVTLGLGWRPGYIALPLAVAVTLGFVARRVRFEGEHLSPASPLVGARAGHPPGSYRRRWLDVLVVVSVEMCMVFWSADYLVTVFKVDPAPAAAIVSLFFIGMAAGRLAGGQVAGSRSLFLSALLVSAAGFALFWLAWLPALAAAGLLVTGLGIALLYPLSISRALAAWPTDPDRASARGALASGLAFGIAPFALALIADRAGLRPAFLVVPLLLAIVVVNNLVSPARRPSPSTGDHERD